jgi:hypothetical protein
LIKTEKKNWTKKKYKKIHLMQKKKRTIPKMLEKLKKATQKKTKVKMWKSQK